MECHCYVHLRMPARRSSLHLCMSMAVRAGMHVMTRCTFSATSGLAGALLLIPLLSGDPRQLSIAAMSLTLFKNSSCFIGAMDMQVTAGSADRMVNIWEVASRRLLYKLPGHLGSVNDASFHPTEPIIASAASDKNLYLGELAT